MKEAETGGRYHTDKGDMRVSSLPFILNPINWKLSNVYSSCSLNLLIHHSSFIPKPGQGIGTALHCPKRTVHVAEGPIQASQLFHLLLREG